MRSGRRAALACLLSLCVFLAALASCGENALKSPASPSAASRPAATSFTLTVAVFGPSGQPIPRATVRATGPAGSATRASMREVGAIHEVGIPVPGVVTVRVEVPGYDPVEKEVVVTSDVQLDVTLTATHRDSASHVGRI